MLFPWRNHEVNIIFSHGFKFYIDYDAEAGGKVLLNENDIETIVQLLNIAAKPDITVDLEVDVDEFYENVGEEKRRFREKESVICFDSCTCEENLI